MEADFELVASNSGEISISGSGSDQFLYVFEHIRDSYERKGLIKAASLD